MSEPRRYSLQALLDATGLGEHALGQQVGLSGSSIKKARELGLIETAADKYACRAGLTPWLVWPEWLEDAEVACAECEARFVPSRTGHLCCGRACQQRRNQRTRYHANPEAQRDRARRYYAECGEYVKAEARRRWWADVEAARERQRQRRAA